ncbi:uncharacterized protein [Ranitomeya imitator]|uniref:uncharacterized protein n=1 Tax=Ranitomeya imitator TaxID=111125 RepID=UPI0037E7E964
MDPKKLKKRILSFSLNRGNRFTRMFVGYKSRGNQGYSRVLLQLFGYTGHGKSSFINSCKYVLDDGEEFIEYAMAGGEEEEECRGAMTKARVAFDLTRNITLVDNRGCLTMGSFQKAEIYAQLGNFLPIGEKVKWMKDYTDMMTRLEDAEWNPNYSDFIVPILIYSAKLVLADGERQELQEFLKNCVKMTGVFPIVVITHKTSGDFMEAEKTLKQMGAEVVISIENYTKNDHIKTQGKTKDILMVIHSALKDVKYRLGEKERNPQKDWRERKKFMLEYIHKAKLDKKINDLRGGEKRKKEVILDLMPQIFHRGCINGWDCEMRESERRRAEERKRDKEMENEDIILRTNKILQEHFHCNCTYKYGEDLEKKERERRREEKRDEERRRNNDNSGGGWFWWLFGY